jgi:hypothetical protein
MKTRKSETKCKSTLGIASHLSGWLVCFGAVSLICSSAPAQNLFMSDGYSGISHTLGHIYKFTSNGASSTFAGGLDGPEGLAFDSAGNLFVSIGDNIYEFTPAGVRSTFASGTSGALAFDAAGNLFVADGGSIYKFAPGGARSTFASGTSGALAFDAAGNVFVAADAIYKFTPDGVRSTFASGLSYPYALAFDSAGNLFVTDWGNPGVAGYVYKYTSDGVRSTFAALGAPLGLAFDSSGNLLVMDEDTCNIYKFTPGGVRTVFAKTPFCMDQTGFLAFQPKRDTRSAPAPAAPLPAGPRSFANLSTRLRTELGDDVAIGGFIINGNAPKTVIVRACGPSVPVAGNLADPTLELHDGTGQVIATNDNWISNRNNIMWSGLAPKSDHEAAIVTTLSPGSYTAVVRGVSNTSGVALVEIFDLSGVTDSKLANISTRGKVETGDDMMIGGFVIGGDQPTRVLVRVIGPSLTGAGIADALPDSVLQLFNSSGSLIFENDDWRSAQKDQIEATGLAPADDRESAIVATLPPGSYTAIVRGKNDTIGVALVEIYNLETN